MLSVNNLSLSYGKNRALSNVSFEVQKGEIFSIIGANGAGKSSLLRCISGLVKPMEGTIYYEGKPLPKEPHKITAAGIVHVPEGRRIFAPLTVKENLKAGAFLVKSRSEIEARIEEQYKIFPRLKERENQYAGTLSGGEQQMLAIARALMSRPKLILLDEPSLGLAPLVVKEVFRIIEFIREQGVTVLLVEQNAKKALSLADHAVVLENGIIRKTGTGKELLNDQVVKEAYLGAGHSD
ncbi:MAG TPA: ABC transporter ATP-binding protein [Thermoclostridium caenicola]|uniref:ABC transporter ATP-binding protein n=1 Tax=Thermoclostridium caenicola TaxID=659425 RepID=UPI002CFB46B2|nr:ABC transporter ATP-binding protein [Thermoclostridium caenicola]HOL83783.1 ABC transporter ATP-binding protein [Thermoclostridium caenicola]HPO75805.1 ABC transporter ATP-binding protein [Thermoclostridium caenicola]